MVGVVLEKSGLYMEGYDSTMRRTRIDNKSTLKHQQKPVKDHSILPN